jgi:parallel beta-helix repeat protein
MKPWIITALAVFVASTIGQPSALARTWYVNTAGTGDAPTIAAALDSCAAGDSVLVAPGTYQIASHLFINANSVTLVSEAGAEATILQQLSSHVYMLIFNESVVEGFTFNGISLGNNGSWTQGGRISKNIFHGTGEAYENAMLFWEQGTLTISGNCIHSYSGTGVFLSESSGFTFEHNTITGCGTAIALDGSYPWDAVRFNLIVGNQYGIIDVGAATLGLSCNDVFGNSVANYYGYGDDPTGTNGNISVDPQFCAVDPAGTGNFFLQSDSPCAPGNHPDGTPCGVIGARPVGCKDVSVRQATWGTIKSMYR